MDKHKGKALEDGCLCEKCSYRFECFTQERIFSNPIFQGLFEALMAQGFTKEEALEMVASEIKARIGSQDSLPVTIEPAPWTPYEPSTGTPYYPPYTITCGDTGNDVIGDGTVSITYSMNNGKDVSWTANVYAQ